MNPQGPLIAQSDLSLLLDAHHADFDAARADIAEFAALEKSPEHMHAYRIDPLSLWNAASAGLGPRHVLERLERWARYELPRTVADVVAETMGRFGRLVLAATDDPRKLRLACSDEYARAEISGSRKLAALLEPEGDGFLVDLVDRGTLKRELVRIGWPVRDEAPLAEGDPFALALRGETASGRPFALRPYQTDAVKAFLGSGGPGSGFGVAVLPCGAGKTVIGMAVAAAIGRKTLIVTTNVAAAHQWMDELVDKSHVDPNDIGEYSGFVKNVRPITIATYQILVWRPDKQSDFPHFSLFRSEKWGLVIYDEVHLLPAPVFRVVAEIQAVRRLGLTATLIREDGLEEDVFSLIGPKRYDVPWKDLERKGFIAEAYCREIRIELAERDRVRYAAAGPRERVRVAAENARKTEVVRELVANHPDDHILVIGQYLAQVGALARELDAPLITGAVPNAERERLYREFREGRLRVLVVSKVANFAIDLPDASVAIQVSGAFGSRQEEAQRLGRILRPKDRNSFFYSVVSRFTLEEEFADNRRRFLTEQGYRYIIEAWDEREWAQT